MNTEFETLERQLSNLRPVPLPALVRQDILHEMGRPVSGHGPTLWLFGHHAGLQIALAGALSLALVASWHWMPTSPRPSSDVNQTGLADADSLSGLPSLAFLEAKFVATSQISINTVAVLRSPSILTNTQIRR